MMQIINSDIITSHIKEFTVLVTKFAILIKDTFRGIYLSDVLDLLRRTRLKVSLGI